MSLGEAVVDLAAVEANLRTVAATAGTELMAVVKAAVSATAPSRSPGPR